MFEFNGTKAEEVRTSPLISLRSKKIRLMTNINWRNKQSGRARQDSFFAFDWGQGWDDLSVSSPTRMLRNYRDNQANLLFLLRNEIYT